MVKFHLIFQPVLIFLFLRGMSEQRESIRKRWKQTLTEKELIDHIDEVYNLSPEYIFKKFPDYYVFRHQKSKEWFGVLMSVPEEKIYDDASDYRTIDILDLKVDPELGGVSRGKEEYLPACCMNKGYWVSVDLCRIKRLNELAGLIDESFKPTQ